MYYFLFTGVHSTYFRNIAAGGAALEHRTSEPLDVIQNQADHGRVIKASGVDGLLNPAPVMYTRSPDANEGVPSSAGNVANLHSYYDQLVTNVNVDLVFTASRPFPMEISISVVRFIEPTAPFALTDKDVVNVCNNLSNKGMLYSRMKTEWLHTFTLPALKTGKVPPHHSVNKKLVCNWMQTNTFNQDTVAMAQEQAAVTQLGNNLKIQQTETVDGDVSGSFLVLIKYRVKQSPVQFTVVQTTQAHSNGNVQSTIEIPTTSDERYNMPGHTGAYGSGGAGPFGPDQGNEAKGSFQVVGKMVTGWGFRQDTEAIPSVMSQVSGANDFRKSQSLNICPTLTGDANFGIYEQSPSHTNLAANTPNGP